MEIEIAPELRKLIKQLEKERDGMLLAANMLGRKFEETGEPTFRRMAAKAVDRAAAIQREIEKLKLSPGYGPQGMFAQTSEQRLRRSKKLPQVKAFVASLLPPYDAEILYRPES